MSLVPWDSFREMDNFNRNISNFKVDQSKTKGKKIDIQ